MQLDEMHRQIAAAVLSAAARHGFALAGGCALIAHGITSRATEDVDLFTDKEHGVAEAAGAVEASLAAAGFSAERQDKTGGLGDLFEGMDDGLAEWIVAGSDGRQMLLQMSYFERQRDPLNTDIGPLLALDDVVAGKIAALASRAAERDYIDTAAAIDCGYSVSKLITLARDLDPGLEDRDFAEAGDRLDRLEDEAFARYNLSASDVARLRDRFASWPRSRALG